MTNQKALIISNRNPDEIKIESNYDKKYDVWRINVELRDNLKEIRKSINRLRRLK